MRYLLRESGLATIAELILASTILVIVLLPIYTLLYGGMQTQKQVTNYWTLQKATTEAINELARELRGAVKIIDAQTNRVAFKNTAGITIRYYLSDQNLMKTEESTYLGGTSKLEKIALFRFAYYDSSNNPSSVTEDIESVKISLAVKHSSEPLSNISLTSRVRLRNH